MQLTQRAAAHLENTAIIDDNGTYTYQNLLEQAQQVSAGLLQGSADLNEQRIAFLCPPSFDYVAVQWGIWLAGGIAVPLCVSHPLPEMEYVASDTGASLLIAHPAFEDRILLLSQNTGVPFKLTTAFAPQPKPKLPDVASERRALILYTSGTTNKPKGVVSTHANIDAQVHCLVDAWGWTQNDHILHVLPLHHTHGIINKLCCALWVGATCTFLPQFDAQQVWDRFKQGGLTLFMAVPTVYHRLIDYWEQATPEEQKALSAACKAFRLMVSGSAALPVSTLERWEAIAGHRLLERYGMTEIGMALSNPLEGERRAGFVGQPLPGIQIRLVDEAGEELIEAAAKGQIQVKGPNVFLEYWQRPEATTESFQDGWFCTGDIASVEDGYYRIHGRSSVDIIKTGGYKVSALEIEEVLRTHPAIKECAVVGIPDPDWGERVAVAIVTENNAPLTLEVLRPWAKERLAPYKVPSATQVVEALPRNVMGKVTKKEVKKLFE